MRAALRHRDFRYLLAGQTVSQTGDWLYNVALIVFVLRATGSPAWVAAASIARLLPYTLFGTIGGVIADRYDRKRIMIVADVARGIIMLGLTLVTATADGHGAALIAMSLAALSTVFSSAYLPCVSASTPSLVGEEDLTAANAITGAVFNVSLALGPMVGGLLLVLGSSTLAFAGNALTFFGSALLTLAIRKNMNATAEDDEDPAPLGERLRGGFRAIASSAEVLLLVALSIAFTFTYGQEIVLYALTATQLLHAGGDAIAFMYAAIGVGGILAAGFTGRLGHHPKQGAILILAGCVSGIPLILLAFVTRPGVAYALLIVEGAAVIFTDVISLTMLQRILPPDVLGRVFGIFDSLTVAGILIGSLLAPVIVAVFGLQAALVLAGSLLVVFTLLVLPRARNIDRKAAARVGELRPRVESLERLGIFEAASPQTLEALAASLTEEVVSAGEVVIREGDPPDDLFVIVSGTLDVTST